MKEITIQVKAKINEEGFPYEVHAKPLKGQKIEVGQALSIFTELNALICKEHNIPIKTALRLTKAYRKEMR